MTHQLTIAWDDYGLGIGSYHYEVRLPDGTVLTGAHHRYRGARRRAIRAVRQHRRDTRRINRLTKEST